MTRDMIKDTYTCKYGGTFRYSHSKQRKSSSGYVSEIKVYTCEQCQGCGNRSKALAYGPARMEVSEKLDRYKNKANKLLQSPEGLRLRGLRCREPEFVFSVIKHAMGFTRFNLRGLGKVTVEAGLLFMAYNMKRYAMQP